MAGLGMAIAAGLSGLAGAVEGAGTGIVEEAKAKREKALKDLEHMRLMQRETMDQDFRASENQADRDMRMADADKDRAARRQENIDDRVFRAGQKASDQSFDEYQNRLDRKADRRNARKKAEAGARDDQFERRKQADLAAKNEMEARYPDGTPRYGEETIQKYANDYERSRAEAYERYGVNDTATSTNGDSESLDSVLDRARAAIRNGAPRDAVEQHLRANGFDVSGL